MKILTDCAADLSPEEIKALDITVAPLFIQFPNEEVDATKISPDDFYNRLRAMNPMIPTTAQPSAGIFANLYQKLNDAGEAILSIHISSGLSGTIQSAHLGAEQTTQADVTFFDSMTLSGAQRFQVIAAALAVKAGWAKDTILDRLKQIRAATEIIYTLETLEYLAHGGRIGRIQALAGSLLKIKPVIRVDRADGKYSTVGKARTMNNTMAMMVDHLVEMYGSKTPVWVSVLHGQLAEKAETLASTLSDRLNIAKLEIRRISPVLGVHTGPGIVGVSVLPFNLVEELLAVPNGLGS